MSGKYDFLKLLNLLDSLQIVNVMCLLLFAAGLALLVWYLCKRAVYRARKYKFLINKSRTTMISKITEMLLNNKFLEKVLNNIAMKVSMFTDYSYSKNIEIATVVLLGFVLGASSAILVIMPQMKVVWYVLLVYLCFGVLFIMLLIFVINVSARLRFTSKLPETLKLLNSRYISQGNILKAISLSIEFDDFDTAVKKVMRIIRDVLIRNDMDEIERTFNLIEQNYKNEYLTLLLNLIKQAHYKGGENVIKQQFENATEEILLDIENQKDLSSTVRMYILLAIIMPGGIIGIEKFNIASLNEKAVVFYQSTTGNSIKLCIMLSLIIYIGYMLLLERSV